MDYKTKPGQRLDARVRKAVVNSAEECRENGSGSLIAARGKLNSLFVENGATIARASLRCLALGDIPPLAVV